MANFLDYLDNHHQILKAAKWQRDGKEVEQIQVEDDFFRSLDRVKQNNNQVFIIGNGGSASIASHAVVDFVNALSIPAFTIHDSSLLTCMTNDHGYENAFSMVLKKIAKPGDFLVAISSSGNSQNILKAHQVMLELGGECFSLSGFKDDNHLKQQQGGHVWLPSESYGHVEVGHMLIMHYLIDQYASRSVLIGS